MRTADVMKLFDTFPTPSCGWMVRAVRLDECGGRAHLHPIGKDPIKMLGQSVWEVFLI